MSTQFSYILSVALVLLLSKGCSSVMDVPLNDQPEYINVHLKLRSTYKQEMKDFDLNFKKIGYPTRAHLWNRKANQFCHSMMPSDLEVNGNYRFSQQVQISNESESVDFVWKITRKRRRVYMLEQPIFKS